MKIIVVTGEYGSGKTEFVLNLAVKLSTNHRVVVSDLDIINYYYKSQHSQELLSKHKIELVGSNLESNNTMDLPAVSFAAKGIINEGKADYVIFDLAGSANGAKVMPSFVSAFNGNEVEVLLVTNIFRERTETAEGIKDVIAEVENAMGLKVTGLVNNSNLINDTKLNDIIKGKEIMSLVDVPIKYTMANIKFKNDIEKFEGDKVYFEQLIVRSKWM